MIFYDVMYVCRELRGELNATQKNKEKSVYLPSSHLGAWEPGSHSGLSGPWAATADTVKSPFETAATLVMRRARPARKEGLADPALLTTLLHVSQLQSNM